MHALNREVTQWDRPCINIFCDDGKIPIRVQIMTAWDDCLIFVAWLTAGNPDVTQTTMMLPLQLIFYINITRLCLPQH